MSYAKQGRKVTLKVYTVCSRKGTHLHILISLHQEGLQRHVWSPCSPWSITNVFALFGNFENRTSLHNAKAFLMLYVTYESKQGKEN